MTAQILSLAEARQKREIIAQAKAAIMPALMAPNAALGAWFSDHYQSLMYADYSILTTPKERE